MDLLHDKALELTNLSLLLLSAPIPIYILGPLSDEHSKYFTDSNGSELCENIIYLGKIYISIDQVCNYVVSVFVILKCCIVAVQSVKVLDIFLSALTPSLAPLEAIR